jgi:hypothetical protein
MDVMQIHANFMADTGQFVKSVEAATDTVHNFTESAEQSASDVQRSFNDINNASRKMMQTLSAVAAIGAGALTIFGVKAFNAAARVEELDIAMRAVGKSSNYTYTELTAATKAIADNGIEMDSAQEIALKFAKNNLDLATASKVARVAQDLAVISQANSTETTNRLIHAVITQNSMVLRQAGIQKTAGEAYKDYAREVGKTTNALSAQEKQTAIVNLILKEGELVAGTYEASMRSAGKILRSFPRIIKAIHVGFGTMLSQGLAPVILSTYQMVAAFSKLVSEGGALHPLMQGLSAVFIELGNTLRMAMDSATRFLKTFTFSEESISGFVKTVRQALPVVAALGAGLAAMGGQQILGMIPGLRAFAGLLNPVVVGLVVLIATMPKLQQAFGELVAAVKPAIPAFIEIGKVAIGTLSVALEAVVPLVKSFAAAIKPVAKFLEDNSKAIGAVVGPLLTFFIVLKSLTTIKAFVAGIFLVKGAFIGLFAVMMANPILALIAAVIALGTVIVIAARKSDEFREIVSRAFEKVADFVLLGVKAILKILNIFALAFLETAKTYVKIAAKAFGWIPGIGPKLKKASEKFDEFSVKTIAAFDAAAVSAEKFRDKSVDAVNAAIAANKLFGSDAKDRRGADYFRPGVETGKKKKVVEEDDIVTGINDLKDNLKKAVRAYNDFIKFEFAKDFTKGAEQARGAILKGLDLLENIFEEKAKGLTGQALKDLEKGFDAVRKQVRSFIPQAELLAATFENVEERLNKAEDNLERALESRAEAVNKLNQLFREPFGEPSALQRSLSSAEATVDSIINMYDDLIQTITERFEGIDEARRDELINFLTDQTAALVALARKRMTAVKVLEEAQKDLDDLLDKQRSFQTDLTSSLKGFATAIANLSQTDSASTLKVIKTATGLVITQLQQSSSGIDKITKQLQDRLRTIRDFGNNIRTLLASGLNREYIKQLLEAGPEAAGLTAAALATAGADQISEINNLYAEIDSMSNAFGQDMSKTFYQNAVDMATAFRDGAAAEVNSITAQMDAIRVSIEAALAPLRDMASNLGKDMMAELLKSIQDEKAKVLAEIQALVNEIARLMAQAAAAINVSVTSKPGAVGGGGGGGITDTAAIQSMLGIESKELRRLQDKLAAGGLGTKALDNLRENLKFQEFLVNELKIELKSATSPNPVVGKTNSAVPGVTNVNSGAVQITVTNNAGTGALEAGDIEAAVTNGMLAALDGRRMVAV